MRYIVATQMHNGQTRYLTRSATTGLRKQAHRYRTSLTASNALLKQRLSVGLDSAWHHGYVTPDAPEPEYADPQPNDGPAARS